ncbi:hypothetical protein [Rhodopseudomonas sp.]
MLIGLKSSRAARNLSENGRRGKRKAMILQSVSTWALNLGAGRCDE